MSCRAGRCTGRGALRRGTARHRDAGHAGRSAEDRGGISRPARAPPGFALRQAIPGRGVLDPGRGAAPLTSRPALLAILTGPPKPGAVGGKRATAGWKAVRHRIFSGQLGSDPQRRGARRQAGVPARPKSRRGGQPGQRQLLARDWSRYSAPSSSTRTHRINRDC